MITASSNYSYHLLLYLPSQQMGIIAISAVDQLPKIKIYRDSNGDCKGDCALCYNAEGSLAMALEVLHEGYIRPGYQISIKKAEFVASGEVTNTATDDGTGTGTETQTLIPNQFKPSRPKLSQAQVKVAKSAMRQALTWNEDDDMGLSKSKALKIVVLEGSCSATFTYNDIVYCGYINQTAEGSIFLHTSPTRCTSHHVPSVSQRLAVLHTLPSYCITMREHL